MNIPELFQTMIERRIALSVAILIGWSFIANAGQAGQFSVVYNSPTVNGGLPAGLAVSGSTLFGVTSGGPSNIATVFGINTDGSNYTTLHSFNIKAGVPSAGVVVSGVTLFGTTTGGGTSNYGSVYSLNTDGTGFNVLHSFVPEYPGNDEFLSDNVTVAAPTVYGVTPTDGAHNYGTVYSMNTDGTNYTKLYSFGSPDMFPRGGVTLSGSSLYGMTGNGFVFSVNTDGSGYARLATITTPGPEGLGGYLLVDGPTIYGTTYNMAYKVNLDGSGFTILHSFLDQNNAPIQTMAGLMLVGSTLYGTTQNGGATYLGTIFQVNTDGTGFATLHEFTGTADGQNPNGGLVLSGSTLYGTTMTGGQFYSGDIFGINISRSWAGTNSTLWADSGNWSGPVPGATTGTISADTAVFNQSALHSAVTIDAGRNIRNILFDTASVNPLIFGATTGNALILSNNGTIQTTGSVVNPQTVNAPLVLEGSCAFTSAAIGNSATLNFGRSITPGAPIGTTILTLSGSNAGANTISGVLADNGAGQLAISKSDSGVWILSANNTYSGGTTVSGGTLTTTATGSISSGPLIVSAAGTITSSLNLGASQTVSSLSGTLAGSGVASVNIPLVADLVTIQQDRIDNTRPASA